MNNQINLQNSACERCGLCKIRKNVVNGKGSPTAKILLVGEWPGSPEDKTGSIFNGPIWEDVNRILNKAGISPSDVFITNVIRCVPKAPNPLEIRDPTKEEILACSDYLDQEIDTIKPNVIVPMGTIAVRRILGKVTTIKANRGAEIWSDRYNCKVMPVYHPILLKRTPQYEGFTIEDFRRIYKSAQYAHLTPKKLGTYVIIDTIDKFNQLIEKLSSAEVFAYDTETTSLDFTKGKVLCVSFSWKEGTGCTLPLTRYRPREEKIIEYAKRKVKKKINGKMQDIGFRDIPKEKIVVHDEYEDYWGNDQLFVLSKLKDIFSNEIPKIAHNGKFDNQFLKCCFGISVNKFVFDTMLAHHLLNENAEGMHDLKECAWNYTDMGGYDNPIEEWFQSRKIPLKKRNYSHLPIELLYPYAAMDTDVTIRLYNLFKSRIVEEQLQSLMNRLVMPLSETLMEAELAGVLLDKNKMDVAEAKINADITQKEADLNAKVGTRIEDGKAVNYNFNSNDQLGELLYEKLKLPVLNRTETGLPSCNEATLKELAKQHEIPQLVLAYREVKNLLSKYIEGLRERVDTDYIIHTSFLIHGTVTGRLSSSDPNLQNIPREPIADVYVKDFFVARPSYIWVEADYGQAEFRHWANYSQDQKMIMDIIAADNGTGPDIHKLTASEAYKISIEQVTKQLRDNAKRVVFGIMYGRQAESIAEQLGISVAEAQHIIDTFLAKYPIARAWLNYAVLMVQKDKQIRSVFGRIRRLPGIDSPLEYIRDEHKRLAMNSPIQSAASDMTCNAANRIRLAFKDQNINGGIRILVHDAIYCEIQEKDFERGILLMKDCMEKPIQGITVPMKAEFKVGTSWGDAKTYEIPTELVTKV